MPYFSTATVLSIVTDCFQGKSLEDVQLLLSFLRGRSIMMHEMPSAMIDGKTILQQEFPDLPDKMSSSDVAGLMVEQNRLMAEHGFTLFLKEELAGIIPDDVDPITSLAQALNKAWKPEIIEIEVNEDQDKDLLDILPPDACSEPGFCTSEGYHDWEQDYATPKLKELGYEVGRWRTTDGDSFGPLVRSVELTKDGKKETYYYG